MLLRRDRVLLAIDIVLDVAFHAGRGAVTAGGDIADRLGVQRRGIEPVLQALTRAGLLDSTRGPRGGYRLARAPRATFLHEVAAAVAEEAEHAAPHAPLSRTVTAPLWDGLEAEMSARLALLTVGDLLKRAADAGLRRPQTEPLDFAI